MSYTKGSFKPQSLRNTEDIEKEQTEHRRTFSHILSDEFTYKASSHYHKRRHSPSDQRGSAVQVQSTGIAQKLVKADSAKVKRNQLGGLAGSLKAKRAAGKESSGSWTTSASPMDKQSTERYTLP